MEMAGRKSRIYYARTYRKLKSGGWKGVLFVCILVIPALFLLLWKCPEITRGMSWLAVRLLCDRFRGLQIQIVESKFPVIGKISMVELPTVYPNMMEIIVNLLVMTGLVIFACTGKRKGKPVSIFSLIVLVTHLINCVYFLFGSNYFPYTAYQYSDLYMKQQIGIWMFFIILAGCTIGFMGNRGILYKILAFWGTLLYSGIFGVARYVFFLYILERFSIFYMALLFFVFGPFFDFLYLVGIYALYINKMEKIYDSGDGREEWAWS